MRDGFGTSYFPSGAKHYDGQWVGGKWSGQGTEYYLNGTRKYEGYLTNHEKHGTGASFYPNGSIQYDGEWTYNKYQGEGISYYQNGHKEFDGGWINGLKYGKCKQYNEFGTLIYEGNTRDGFADGYGEKYDHDGKLACKGLWKDNKIEVYYMTNEEKLSGYQKVVCNVEELYVGQVCNGVPSGHGVIWSKDNAVKVYEGNFVKGKKCGFGKFYGEDFDQFPRYIGYFKNDSFCGDGMLFHYNGKLEFRGRFLEDEVYDLDRFFVGYTENGGLERSQDVGP